MEWKSQVLSVPSHLYSFLLDNSASIRAVYLVVVISNSLVFRHEFPWWEMHVFVLLQKGNESRIPVVFPLNTHYYYSVSALPVWFLYFKKEADRWEGDRQSMVTSWEVLGRKYGEVNLTVSFARGSTCHENTQVKKKNKCSNKGSFNWKKV